MQNSGRFTNPKLVHRIVSYAVLVDLSKTILVGDEGVREFAGVWEATRKNVPKWEGDEIQAGKKVPKNWRPKTLTTDMSFFFFIFFLSLFLFPHVRAMRWRSCSSHGLDCGELRLGKNEQR